MKPTVILRTRDIREAGSRHSRHTGRQPIAVEVLQRAAFLAGVRWAAEQLEKRRSDLGAIQIID